MPSIHDVIRDEFGLHASGMTVGGQGALGEVWRLSVDDESDLAVKLLAKEPSESLVALEVAHTRQMVSHGVRVAASIPNRHGGFVSRAPGGWLRVSEWIDGVLPDPADPHIAELVGDTLGRMHANAAPTAYELDGTTLDSWYCVPPDATAFGDLVPELLDLLDIRNEATSLVLCHRDFHPENALLTADGMLAVLDWDNLGPADPTQELASVLLHWFADKNGVLGSQMAACVAAYESAGGTGNLTSVDDFAMHIATSLNFLARQLKEPAESQRAAAEIAESLRLLPTIEVLVECVSWAGVAELVPGAE